jgi:hypothetical protein
MRRNVTITRTRHLRLVVPLFFGVLLAQGSTSAESDVPQLIGPEAGAIQNAGAGTEAWFGGPRDGETRLVKTAVRVSDYTVNSMLRISWADYETKPGEYHFEKLDRYFASCLRYKQKLNIGCFMTSSNEGLVIDGASCHYPAYVHEALQKSKQPDVKFTSWLGKVARWEPCFENAYFFERYNALLQAFATYLKQPVTVGGKTILRQKLLRYIEMRHFGWWGEGAYPKPLVPSNSACLIRFADAFLHHFPEIRILVPTNGMSYHPTVYDTLKEYHFHLLGLKNAAGPVGIFRDNWGWDERGFQKLYYAENKYEQGGVRLYELLRDRWKIAPVVGEPAQIPPRDGFRPYSDLLEQVRYLHPAVIRNCNVSDGPNRSATNPTTYSVFKDPQALANFHKMYALIGFRYLFTAARTARRDDGLEISIDWLNIGLTPTYDRWQIRYFLADDAGKETWAAASTLDLRTVFPDEKTPPGVVNPQKVRTHTDRFRKVPGTGKLYLQIVDPDGVSPPMALSIKGRTAPGAYRLP